MPPIKVKKLELEHGDLGRIIPALVNEHGQLGAALRLGVSTGTISRWLRDNGYERRTTWVQNGEQMKRAKQLELASLRGKLAALRDMLEYGPDGGAGADMLEVAHEADKLAALIARLQDELEESA